MPKNQKQFEAESASDPMLDRLLPAEIPMSELEAGLRIDRRDLEGSLETQPDSFFRVAIQMTLATSRRDAAKQRLAELEATKDASLRHDAQVADEKITEKEIESEKRRDPAIMNLQRELLRLNTKLGLISALKDAFVQRSYILKDLCALEINGLYTEAARQSHPVDGYREERSRIAKERMAEFREERARNEHARTADRSGSDRTGHRRPDLPLARK